MTPLEAAQRLAEQAEPHACEYSYDENGHTPVLAFCGASTLGPHLPGCPWLAMPRIVAALEAAAQLVQEDAHTNDYEVPYQGQMACNSCGAITRSHAWTDKEGRTFPEPHTADCSWQALKAALKGDEAEPVPAQRCRDCHRLLRDHIIMCTGPR